MTDNPTPAAVEAVAKVIIEAPGCFLWCQCSEVTRNLARKRARAILASPEIAAKDARIAELEAENARLREALEKVKPECGLGCRGEYDDGRCGLNGGLPCCTVRLALRAALAAAGKKEDGQ